MPQAPEAIDLSNRYGVGTFRSASRNPRGDGAAAIVVTNPPINPLLTAEEALVLAAWLVRTAQPQTGVMFETIRTGVMNS